MDELAQFIRVFATSMQASRVHHFGWEPSINDLAPDRLRLLAEQLPAARAELVMAANLKEASNGPN